MTKRNKLDSGLPDWLKLLETDPMSALVDVREAVLEAEFINDDTKQNAIGFMVECNRKARNNPRYFASLQDAATFSDDELGPRKISTLVGRFILDVKDATGSPRYEKARSYGQLADYFADTDYSAEKVANYLRRNGIRNSLEHIKKVEREAEQEAQRSEQANEDEHNDLLLTNKDLSHDARHREAGPSRPSVPRAEVVKRALLKEPAPTIARPKLNLDNMLVSEASERHLHHVLETPEGQTVMVTLRREPSKEGQDWKRFVIEDVVG